MLNVFGIGTNLTVLARICTTLLPYNSSTGDVWVLRLDELANRNTAIGKKICKKGNNKKQYVVHVFLYY